jgi:hypothetical protein
MVMVPAGEEAQQLPQNNVNNGNHDNDNDNEEEEDNHEAEEDEGNEDKDKDDETTLPLVIPKRRRCTMMPTRSRLSEMKL